MTGVRSTVPRFQEYAKPPEVPDQVIHGSSGISAICDWPCHRIINLGTPSVTRQSFPWLVCLYYNVLHGICTEYRYQITEVEA